MTESQRDIVARILSRIDEMLTWPVFGEGSTRVAFEELAEWIENETELLRRESEIERKASGNH